MGFLWRFYGGCHCVFYWVFIGSLVGFYWLFASVYGFGSFQAL